jgi:GNAT superfamily N-acetyltransferase
LLPELLDGVAAGRFPPADGSLVVVDRPPGERVVAAAVGFSAYGLIAADVPADWVRDHVIPGDLGAALSARLMTALAHRLGARAGSLDMLLLAPPAGAAAGEGPELAEIDPAARADHPRLARAFRYRDEVRAFAVEGGLLVLGRGLAGRWEVSVEVDPSYRGRGLARRLISDAHRLVPGGAPLWAQVPPANVASVRAFLAAGYRPVGAEVLFTRAG